MKIVHHINGDPYNNDIANLRFAYLPENSRRLKEKKKMALPKLNEKLIEEVLAHIKKFPEAYEQGNWARACDVTKSKPCGVAGCFAGWTILLTAPKKKRQGIALRAEDNSDFIQEKATRLLGLTGDEAEFLFDIAEGTATQNYKLIVKRLTHIRESRQIATFKLTHEKDFGKAFDYTGEL